MYVCMHAQLCLFGIFHGIFLARIVEWVTMPSSRGSSQPRDGTCVSYVCRIGKQVLYHEHYLYIPFLYMHKSDIS